MVKHNASFCLCTVLQWVVVVVLGVASQLASGDSVAAHRRATSGASSHSMTATQDPALFANQTYYLVCANATDVSTFSVTQGAPPDAGNNASILLADIIYNESYNDVGWDFVQVTPSAHLLLSENVTDQGRTAYFAAGYLEGYVTSQRIGETFVGAGLLQEPPAVLSWIAQHVAFMTSEVADNTKAGYPSTFWTQLGNLLAQLEGITAGYSAAVIADHRRGVDGAVNRPNLTFADVFLLNFNNELSDVYNVMNVTMLTSFADTNIRRRTAASSGSGSTSDDDGLLQFLPGNLHCSALIKVTNDDIFVAHDTWNAYRYMLRQYKIYKFQTTVSMSSYAGTIASGDDWYQTSTMLGIQETTNDFVNRSLLQYIIPESSSEFLRVMVATFLATNGREWVELFQFNNSGTYCNQWMILDYKLYTPGAVGDALPDNLLWVAEQIPGNVTSADVTSTLRSTSYWASFNIPYFPNIYNISGFAALERIYGVMTSYTKYARPEIFKRNQSDVVDLATMRALMRYNNWQHDPLSEIPLCPECNPRGSPWLAISFRGDLVNATVLPSDPVIASQFMRTPMGGIDSKIGSYEMIRSGSSASVINGPTNDQQPVFIFDDAFPGMRPAGCANMFDFPWTFFAVVGTEADTHAQKGADTSDRNVVIGLCVGMPLALVVLNLWLRYRRERDDGATSVDEAPRTDGYQAINESA